MDRETAKKVIYDSYLPNVYIGEKLQKCQKYGFIKAHITDKSHHIKIYAIKYFNRCKEILGLEKIKYEFTKEEADLLRINNITVNDESIIE